MNFPNKKREAKQMDKSKIGYDEKASAFSLCKKKEE